MDKNIRRILMILQIIFSFLGTLAFSIIFNVEKKELFLCGAAGAIGWFFYLIVSKNNTIVFASFISTLVITFISRILANIRKTPITVFLISGIIPLVPGAGIYYTMLNILTSNNSLASYKGIETMKISGVIAVGIIIVLSLPKWLFTFGKK